MTTSAHPVGVRLCTVRPAPPAGPRERDALAAPALRRSLAAMVRRRVPGSDAEDVAQTVLCDALAAPGIPSDPEDLRRFVAGIARHKVADFHRGARRHRHDATTTDEPSVEPAPIEARAILARIADSVASSSSPRERETLEWLVREHAGEELKTIAHESGVPAPAVRQRVSRLRRLLRAQWGHALAVLLVAGGCAALAERTPRQSSPMVADPGAEPTGLALLPLQGDWRVEGLVPRSDSASTATTATLEAKIVTIRIRGRRVELLTPARTRLRAVGQATRRADGSIALDLLDEAGGVQHITAKVENDGEVDRVQLVVHDGHLQGTARLVRTNASNVLAE